VPSAKRLPLETMNSSPFSKGKIEKKSFVGGGGKTATSLSKGLAWGAGGQGISSSGKKKSTRKKRGSAPNLMRGGARKNVLFLLKKRLVMGDPKREGIILGKRSLPKSRRKRE